MALNENTKDLIILLLDYMSKTENKLNKTDLHEIIYEYEKLNALRDERISIQFGILDNKISQLNAKIDSINTETPVKELNILPEAPSTPKISKSGTQPTNKTSKTSTTSTTKMESKQDKLNKIIECLPTMTEKEAEAYFNEVKTRCKNGNNSQLSKVLTDDPTVKVISDKTGLSQVTVNNYIKTICEREDIKSVHVSNSRSPKVYVRIISDKVSEKEDVNPEDELYVFKDRYDNPGYDLIDGLYVKPRRGNGKTLQVNAKQLHNAKKLIQDKPFTVGLHDKLVGCFKTFGLVNEGTIEGYICRLNEGFFDEVIEEYLNYQHKIMNPHFEYYGDDLLVNGEKIKVAIVKQIIDGIPYGNSDDIEDYSRRMVDEYTDYSSECIRCILENHDDYLLKRCLKAGDDVVENNPQKRREKGYI